MKDDDDGEAKGKDERAREEEKNKNASVKGTLFPHEGQLSSADLTALFNAMASSA